MLCRWERYNYGNFFSDFVAKLKSSNEKANKWIKIINNTTRRDETTALWEYKGGQEDIRKISGKTHRKPPTEKCNRFTYRFYLGLSFVSFDNQNLVHYTKIEF